MPLAEPGEVMKLAVQHGPRSCCESASIAPNEDRNLAELGFEPFVINFTYDFKQSNLCDIGGNLLKAQRCGSWYACHEGPSYVVVILFLQAESFGTDAYLAS